KWIAMLRVPASLDTFNFQHWMYFPCALSPTDAIHHHPSLYLARLAMRAVEKDEAGHSNLHRRFQNTLVGAAAIRMDDVENLLARVAIFLAGRNFNDQMFRFPLIRVADFDMEVIIFAVARMDVTFEPRAQ